MMHKPMKKPNSRSGLSTEAKFEKKEAAVVTEVARHAVPAFKYKLFTRSARLSRSLEQSQNVMKTIATSAPKPAMKNSERKEAPVTRFDPLMAAARTKATGMESMDRKIAPQLNKGLPVCSVR
mmetsp:Transcript_4780/g.12644  ORF Transcript_4780/g.12644 Transcript_4780/m.12644 type:complete len:123 (+) Transcript_4780:3083-3451(+)